MDRLFFWAFPMLILFVCVFSPSVVGAEEIYTRGRLTELDLKNRFMTIQRTNAISGNLEKFDLLIPENTRIKGVPLLDDHVTGREVNVEAMKNPQTGNWETKSVEVI